MPELLTDDVVCEAQSFKGKPREIRDTRVSGLILRVEPSGNKRYICDYYVKVPDPQGKPRRKHRRITIGTTETKTLKQARSRARKLLGEIEDGIDPIERDAEELRQKAEEANASKTLGQFIDETYERWRLSNTLTGKRVKARSAQKDIDRLRRRWEELLDTPLADISANDIYDQRTEWIEDGRAPQAVNRDVSVLRSALSAAVRFKLLDKSPITGMEQVKGDTKRKPRPFTREEQAALLRALRQREARKREKRESFNQWREERGYVPLPSLPARYVDNLLPAVLVSLGTGVRRSELFALRWSKSDKHSRVDLAAKKIILVGEDTKSGQSREIPLGPKTLAVLKALHPSGGVLGKGANIVPFDGGHVFKGRDGGQLTEVKTPWRDVIADAGLKGRGLTWHSLRHRFCTRLLIEEEVDIYTVKELAGHASIEITARYLDTDEKTKRKAVAGL